MCAVKLESVVSKNRQLSFTVPPEIPSGPVEVLILSKDVGEQRVSLIGFLDALRSEPASALRSDATESAIAAERNTWNE